jgi:hypothetical protein
MRWLPHYAIKDVEFARRYRQGYMLSVFNVPIQGCDIALCYCPFFVGQWDRLH